MRALAIMIVAMSACGGSGPPSDCPREYEDLITCFNACETATCVSVADFAKQLNITDPKCNPERNSWTYCIPSGCPAQNAGLSQCELPLPCQVGLRCDYPSGLHCLCFDGRDGSGSRFWNPNCRGGEYDQCVRGGTWACGTTPDCFSPGANCTYTTDYCSDGVSRMTCTDSGHWVECSPIGGNDGCTEGGGGGATPQCVCNYRDLTDCPWLPELLCPSYPPSGCIPNCPLPEGCACIVDTMSGVGGLSCPVDGGAVDGWNAD